MSFNATPGHQHIIDQGFDLVSLDAGIAQRVRVEAPELVDGRAAEPGLCRTPAQPPQGMAKAHETGLGGRLGAPSKCRIHCSSFTIEWVALHVILASKTRVVKQDDLGETTRQT
jgi:hypothetical protein